MAHRLEIILTALIVAILSARGASAQAWVPAKGEGSVSVLYQNLFVEDHWTARGGRQKAGDIRSNNLLFDVTYGLTDKLALTLAVPFIRSRYSGAFPHPTAQDDGQPHSGFQNVRFSARYNIVDGPVTITPFVGSNVPSHSYEYFAHAALGMRVREFEMGTYVGRLLDPVLPKTFVQARYAYTFAERIEGIHHDRSSLDIEIGYMPTPAVRVFVMGNGQTTHGGVNLPANGFRGLPPELQRHHDRVANLEMLDFGGGVQVSLTKTLDVFGSFMTTTAGRNSHALARGITIGASWSFGGRRIASLSEIADAEEPLIRCLCQK